VRILTLHPPYPPYPSPVFSYFIFLSHAHAHTPPDPGPVGRPSFESPVRSNSAAQHLARTQQNPRAIPSHQSSTGKLPVCHHQ